jgi:CRISPR-associated protein Csb2
MMTRYLCISVTLLDDLYHGKADGEEPEWPPSPWRLFQAMLAGALAGRRKNGWPDARADAFRWLEQREAPLIVAPEARLATVYTFYVPNNDGDKELDRQNRLTSKIARPHRLMNGETLHYLWRIDEEELPSARPYAELLSQESRHLLALGWGIDLVAGNGKVLTADEAATLKGQRWKPWDGVWLPTGMRRVPDNGSLNDLVRCYESFLNSVQGQHYQPRAEPQVFRRIPYLLTTTVAPRPYVGFELRRTDGQWATFRHVDAIKVAAMLRHVTCEAAKDDSHKFPGGTERYVAGHTNHRNDRSPRFSYLPLPTTRHAHADGMIRRVLIAEPFGSDGAQVQWAAQRLRFRPLINDAGQEQALLYSAEDADTVLRSYVQSARMWSSITPVILPGFDDGKYEKAERLLIKAVQQAGLPIEEIEAFVLRKAPFWPGSQHPCHYQRPEYLRGFPAFHVHLRFREPIPGPLAVGSGRHCGLGLFVSEEN